jgi:hypothetical protein
MALLGERSFVDVEGEQGIAGVLLGLRAVRYGCLATRGTVEARQRPIRASVLAGIALSREKIAG